MFGITSVFFKKFIRFHFSSMFSGNKFLLNSIVTYYYYVNRF